MISDIINNIDVILIGSTPAVKAYLGNTVIWEASDDTEYASRTYRHQYFTTEALADNCVLTLNIAKNVSTDIVKGFYYSRDRIIWTPILNTANTNLEVSLPAINTGEKYYWKGVNFAISENGTFNESTTYKNVHLSASANFKVYGNMFSMLYGDDFIGKNYFPDDTVNYIYSGFFLNNTYLIDASNLYFPGLHTKGFTYSADDKDNPTSDEVINSFNDLFNGCTNLEYGPIIEMLTIVGNSSMKRLFKNCTNLKSFTMYCINVPVGFKVNEDMYAGLDSTQLNNMTIYLPTISTWDGRLSNNNKPGTASKTIDLSLVDFS